MRANLKQIKGAAVLMRACAAPDERLSEALPNHVEASFRLPQAASAKSTPTETRAPGRGKVYDSIVDAIGDTPLVRSAAFAAERAA